MPSVEDYRHKLLKGRIAIANTASIRKPLAAPSCKSTTLSLNPKAD